MKFTFSVSPNLHQKQSTKRIMLELMLGLAAVYVFALVLLFYGIWKQLCAAGGIAAGGGTGGRTGDRKRFCARTEEKRPAVPQRILWGGSLPSS